MRPHTTKLPWYCTGYCKGYCKRCPRIQCTPKNTAKDAHRTAKDTAKEPAYRKVSRLLQRCPWYCVPQVGYLLYCVIFLVSCSLHPAFSSCSNCSELNAEYHRLLSLSSPFMVVLVLLLLIIFTIGGPKRLSVWSGPISTKMRPPLVHALSTAALYNTGCSR